MKPFRFTLIFGLTIAALSVLLVGANIVHAGVNSDVVTTCDDAHLATALSSGDLVTFNCGTATLNITSDHILAADTAIDGSNNGHPLTITASGTSFPFYVNAGKTLTLTNVLIADVSGTNSGAVYAQGSLVISNSTFISNNGGAVTANSELTVTNSLFQANSGAYALHLTTNGFGNVSNSQFVSNTNGAIYTLSSLTVNNSQFYSNSIGGAGVGAGIYAYAWLHPQLHLDIISSQFMTNTAHQAGGIAADGGVLLISNTLIVSNTSTYYPGGGLWYEVLNTGDGMQIFNSTINDNQGGGISMNGGSGTVLVSNSWIENNHATVNTAGFDAGDMVLTVTASYIINNHTTSNSPGGLNEGGPAYITGTLFLNNSGGHGGGAYLGNGGSPVFTDTIANSAFLSNTSTTYEGGGVNAVVPLIVADSVFSQNVTPLDGGGLYWWPNTFGGLSVARSLFYANQAQNLGTGGGIYVHGNANIVNSTLYANSAANAGGIQLSNSSSLTLTNDTIIRNTATNPVNYGNLNGGSALTPMTLVNTIVADGSPKNCGGLVTSLGHNLSSDASCLLTGINDLTNTNPLLGPFANNGGPTYSFMPTASSPAVNAGSNTYCPADDQRGVARPIGSACDIGAIESPYLVRQQTHYLYLPLILH